MDTYGYLDKAQLRKMKLEDLKRLAEDMGIETSDCRLKEDYVKAIAAEPVLAEDEAGESDGEPVLAEDEVGESGQETEPKENDGEAEQELDDVERIQVCYVGPNLPGGMLSRGKILYGTRKSIAQFLEPVIQERAGIGKLVVPVRDAERALRAAKTPGTLLHKYAQEVAKGKRNG